MAGAFVVFEGIDGSGKATQLKLLARTLRRRGYRVASVDFPQYYSTFFGKLVGRYLAGEVGSLRETNPYLTALLYAGDRFEAKDRIARWLREGRVVLANRYTGSNMAHQGAKLPAAKRTAFVQFVRELEYRILKIPREKLVIVLDVRPIAAQRLVDRKGRRGYVGGSRRDLHEANRLHLARARAMYLALAKRFAQWRTIRCFDSRGVLSPQVIADRVLALLERERIVRKKREF